MSERKPLNLDELYGTARPVIVVWKERHYELRRPEALTPVEYSRWTKLQAKSGHLMQLKDGDEMTEEQGQELREVIQDALGLFSSELAAAGLPFAAQVQVLEFYTAEVFAGKSGEEAKNPTGA